MPTQIQWRRGTTAQTASFTGAVGEITVDTSKKVLIVHDGVTAGGWPTPELSFVQAAFDTANNVAPQVQPAFNTANGAFLQANAAFAAANNVAPQVQPAFDTANGAFLQANAAFQAANNVAPQVQPAFDTANAAFLQANSVYTQSNTIAAIVTPNFPTSPFGYVYDSLYTALGEHVSGTIYDMKSSPDGSIRIVDAGTLT